jgi:hypothetical protein
MNYDLRNYKFQMVTLSHDSISYRYFSYIYNSTGNVSCNA